MRWIRATAGLVLALCAAAPAPAAAQEAAPAAEEEAGSGARIVPNTWYAQALAYSDSGINVTHFWSKGAMMRAETVIAGHRVVTVVRDDTYYAYDLLARRGIAIGRSEQAVAQDRERLRPFGNELPALLRHGGESIGREELGGAPVQVFQLSDQMGRRQVWVTDDPNQLPIRLRVFRRQTATNVNTDFLNWKRGFEISDAFFQPEPDVELERMGFDEYLKRLREQKPVGSVPVLYTDLLHGY